MPSVFRFVVIVGSLAGLAYWGLAVLATQYEPSRQEVIQPIGNVKVRKL